MLCMQELTLHDIQTYKRKQRIGKYARAIILGVGAVGFLAAAAMAPNALQIFSGNDKRKKWHFKKVRDDLVDKSLLRKTEHRGKSGYELTKKGEAVVAGYELHQISLPKRRIWNGTWHMVMSDIPERLKLVREELRAVLSGMGFVKVQKSVWAYPYPCLEAIILIKKKFNLNKELLYLEVDKLENDHWLRQEFSLE